MARRYLDLYGRLVRAAGARTAEPELA